MRTHFSEWKNFEDYLFDCWGKSIKNIYLTGQNTDPAMYPWLDELIDYIQSKNFLCGIRTNGLAIGQTNSLETIRKCKASIGYSVHTFSSMTQNMMIGRKKMPDWDTLLRNSGPNVRAQIVVTRCNAHEFFDVVRRLSEYPIKYIQARRVSTDTRLEEMAPDIKAYEELYTMISRAFPMTKKFFTDAEEYPIFGKPVIFWRTVKTSVNSMNYFTDGTISDEYFVVEGYQKNRLSND